MTNEIKAIKTKYNGIDFRSRLEARWAVFFDASGIRYVYEPENFVIYDNNEQCTTGYIPDFYFPDFDMYAEVKGSDEQLRKDYDAKLEYAIDFCATPIGEKGLILLGGIEYKRGKLPVFNFLNHHKGVCYNKCVFNCDRIEYEKFDYKNASENWSKYYTDYQGDYVSYIEGMVDISIKPSYIDVPEYISYSDVNKTNDAFNKAITIKFIEDGNTPKVNRL